MLNKIDKNLYDKISIAGLNNNEIDVIVYLNDYFHSIKEMECLYNNIVKFPFVSGFATRLSLKCIIELSQKHCVRYITDSCSVCSLMYKSKRFIGIDSLYSRLIQVPQSSVVIIDTGIYPHIDFCLGRNRIIKFVDLINNKNEMYDDNGHGTFVAGVLCGWGIVDRYSGIDKMCNIIVIKALDKSGETTTVKILEAMQWVLDNKLLYNITTVCMSFGSLYRDEDPLVKGVEVLWNNGLVVVCAGGNSGPQYETIMSPGCSRKVITVGSLDTIGGKELRVADFSSRGPAGNYYKPDMVLPGTNIVSTNVFNVNKQFYTTMSGTSVSTPMVAGVVSLLKSIDSKYTPDQIKYMLISASVPIEGDRNKEGFGYLDLKRIVLI
ncbi:MAG: peptidase S8 [Clostridiales bacterium]|nr:peptidase S8 [Clostridiales bacterium]